MRYYLVEKKLFKNYNYRILQQVNKLPLDNLQVLFILDSPYMWSVP
jgi:hypothetical protein